MNIDTLNRYLDEPESAHDWLRQWGLRDVGRRGIRTLSTWQRRGVTLDLLASMCDQLAVHLPLVSDADMVLNNLERFFLAARSPLSLGTLFERDTNSLPPLLQMFSASQHLSDLLIRDPESYDLLRATDGQSVNRNVLVDEICAEVLALPTEELVMKALRRFKNRETLRVAYGDIVKRQSIAMVTKQISFLADALCEAAVQSARQRLEQKRGVPRRPDRQRARFVVLALGKHGGEELNYSSDIDLIFLSDGPGQTDGERSITNDEFFDRLAKSIVKLLTEPTELGAPYRVDMRLRPEGKIGPFVIGLDAALQYYDISGRTWERQAYVKARAVAGDLSLGREFLAKLEPWIYRRYLNRADITGIKALKRRIEHRTALEGGETRNIKTGNGGIRDIEYVIQFLQLLNGGDLPAIRTGNTLEAIDKLEHASCLTMQERTILEENYEFLRKVEHRLQIMFDLQTHTLPESDDELRKVAIRSGYTNSPQQGALESFRAGLKKKTELDRTILDHLLHFAFGDDTATEPETDLVLDPDPSEETIAAVLGKHGFRDTPRAYGHLMALSTERIQFLSTRRCRHFLASIAPRLLRAISAAPDPDATLVELSHVSDSLGGKGVLWELFSFNEPSMKLCVHLCATSPYLTNILTSSPGMIDELMDSLMVNKLPTLELLEATLDELCRGAEDLVPILQSFKNSYHLRVGVRDILGKEDIQNTHRALSDVAEVCLQQITLREYLRLVEKYGEPTVGDGGDRDGQACEFITLPLGKLGGREPNYHSDLDVIFLYEAEGMTQHRHRGRRDSSTTNQHFFGQLSQRIIKSVTQLGASGQLYELDPRLRPTGKNGTLAISLPEFRKYFFEGSGQLWERQALCKARPIYGSDRARQAAMAVVRECLLARPWQPSDAEEIRTMRKRLEDSASSKNLKRGPGGTVDIEFTVQMLQMSHLTDSPDIVEARHARRALAALNHAGFMSHEDCEYYSRSYRFLRNIEARLRLMNTSARHDIPEDELQQRKLAFLLGYSSAELLHNDCHRFTEENRRRFNRVFDEAAGEGVPSTE